MNAYQELCAELMEQADWWMEHRKDCKTLEAQAIMYGHALKLRYLVERRYEDGTMRPAIIGST